MNATLPPPPVHELGDWTAPSDQELLARLAGSDDEAAFVLLLRRHGPMVLGVCRRVLRDHHDAEDAFQATFAVFARRCRSIRHPERLAGWLYGVAYRTALKLRAVRRRREEVERNASPPTTPTTPPPLECAWREVQEALDEELNGLEAPLRAAIILCYLEGRTHEEAARELGRPVGSMSWLLDRALHALRRRLANRGMILTGGLSSLLLALQGPFPVSEGLLLAALRAAGALGTVSPLAQLVEAVLRDLSGEVTYRVARGVGLALLVLLGVGSASAVGYRALMPPTPGQTQARPAEGGCGGCSK